jgi:hypothetical protein
MKRKVNVQVLGGDHVPKLTWQLKPTKEGQNPDFDILVWETACGRYKVGRSRSTLREGENHFAALKSRKVLIDRYTDVPHYHHKDGQVAETVWDWIEMGKHNRPKDYQSLRRAIEVCESDFTSTLPKGAVYEGSNAETVIESAIENGLDSLPKVELIPELKEIKTRILARIRERQQAEKHVFGTDSKETSEQQEQVLSRLLPETVKAEKPKRTRTKGAGNALLDAVATVLTGAKSPMNHKEIVKQLFARKLWSSSGTTPWQTIASSINVDIKKLGLKSRFRRPAPNSFQLA